MNSEEDHAALPKDSGRSLLGRLHRVLAAVRGGGAKGGTGTSPKVSFKSRPYQGESGPGGRGDGPAGARDEEGGNDRDIYHDGSNERDIYHQGSNDRDIYHHALSHLHASQPLDLRLSVLDELAALLKVYKFEDLPGLWGLARDLIEADQGPGSKEKAVKLIGALCLGENFSRLGRLRADFFGFTQPQGSHLGLPLQLKVLQHITRNAQATAPFEAETCVQLADWLFDLSSQVKSHPRFTTKPIHKELLVYTANFLKFSAVALPEELYVRLVEAVAAVSRECVGKEGGTGESHVAPGDDGWSLEKGCLAVFDVVWPPVY